MKQLVLAVLFILIAKLGLAATNPKIEQIFKIPPYTLKKESGEIILKFEMKQDHDLIIKRAHSGAFNRLEDLPKRYPKGIVHEIALGQYLCDEVIKVEVEDGIDNEDLFDYQLPVKVCEHNKSLEEFTFGFISDTQMDTDPKRPGMIAKVIAHHLKKTPHKFILNTGDVVENGSELSEWYRFFKDGQVYLGETPMVAAIGNHDYKGTRGSKLPVYFGKYMRWKGADSLGNLSYDFPQFRLVVFNSNWYKMRRQERKLELKWLEEQFKTAKQKGLPVVVAVHFPIYSSSLNFITSYSVRKQRARLRPLLEKYGVKVVLSGHTHMYERSIKDGIHYIVAGPAGGRANKPTWKNKHRVFFDPDSLTYTRISIQYGIMKIKTWNQNNILIDQVNIDLKS